MEPRSTAELTGKDAFWFILIPVVMAFVLDQIIKIYIEQTYFVWTNEWVQIRLTQNAGVIGGILHGNLSATSYVAICTFSAFLVMIVLAVQYIIPIRALSMRVGLALLVSSLFANGMDRFRLGYVIDYISLRYQGYVSPFFNLADVFQWIGLVICIFAYWKYGSLLLPVRDMRRQLWIDLKFQRAFCLKWLGVAGGMAFVLGVLTLSAIKTFYAKSWDDMGYFILLYFVATFIYMILAWFVGLIISHRIAGPVYALNKYVQLLQSGGSGKLKLRSGDELKQLEQIALTVEEMAKKAPSLP
jgi:signal peptidase II